MSGNSNAGASEGGNDGLPAHGPFPGNLQHRFQGQHDLGRSLPDPRTTQAHQPVVGQSQPQTSVHYLDNQSSAFYGQGQFQQSLLRNSGDPPAPGSLPYAQFGDQQPGLFIYSDDPVGLPYLQLPVQRDFDVPSPGLLSLPKQLRGSRRKARFLHSAPYGARIRTPTILTSDITASEGTTTTHLSQAQGSLQNDLPQDANEHTVQIKKKRGKGTGTRQWTGKEPQANFKDEPTVDLIVKRAYPLFFTLTLFYCLPFYQALSQSVAYF